MPYTEAMYLAQKSRNRIIIWFAAAFLVMTLVVSSILGFVVWQQQNARNTSQCRSEVVNGYLVSIGDVLEEDGQINGNATQAEIDHLIETREDSRNLYLDNANNPCP